MHLCPSLGDLTACKTQFKVHLSNQTSATVHRVRFASTEPEVAAWRRAGAAAVMDGWAGKGVARGCREGRYSGMNGGGGWCVMGSVVCGWEC